MRGRFAKRLIVFLLVISLGPAASPSFGEAAPSDEVVAPDQIASSRSDLAADLMTMSIEELMGLEVEIAAKRAEPMSHATAAVYVVTSEDIRRSGLRTLPEILRMVPGLNVARIDANTWSISSRGFNDRFSNKLLVMIDGRTAYTPLFSGVFWDIQDVPADNIERIEVIRGPGGTLWGANAVNGVVNVITKHTTETQGGRLSAGGGDIDRGFGDFRYGGKLGGSGTYRLYVRGSKTEGGEDGVGRRTVDEWQTSRGGFRTDWIPSDRDQVRFSGDLYRVLDKSGSFRGPTLSAPFSISHINNQEAQGGNLIFGWTRDFAPTSRLNLRAYYDRSERRTEVMNERRNIWDLDVNHDFSLTTRQHITWGIGYRRTSDHLDNTFDFSFAPSERTDDLVHGFLQDEIAIAPDKLHLTIGSKVERNDYTGFEYQPSARLLWHISENHSVWSAVSRAVRTPSRALDNVRANLAATPVPSPPFAAPVILQSLFGHENSRAENLLAFEAGYRGQPWRAVTLDLTAFGNFYDDLSTAEVRAARLEAPTHVVVPVIFDHFMKGELYGGEAVVNWDATRFLRIRSSYSLLSMQLHQLPGSTAVNPENQEGNAPRHQFQIRSYLDLPNNFELDFAAYYVDNLRTQRIPHYLRFDARVGWRPLSGLELTLAGQNLFDKTHREFGAGVLALFTSPVEVRRSFYGMATWVF
jgi:iron complex outermembrane receptor protein